jgi:hypothetical protein
LSTTILTWTDWGSNSHLCTQTNCLCNGTVFTVHYLFL